MILFERYGPLTLGFFRRRIGNPELAAEMNQELYIDLIRGLDRFRGESQLKTWLFRLAHNRLSNLRRRWRTHLDEVTAESTEEMAEILQAGSEEQPDAGAARQERLAALTRCLGRLPEIERAVIIGQYFDETTLAELTERLALTNPSGARAVLIAGQRKLRRCMAESGFGDSGS